MSVSPARAPRPRAAPLLSLRALTYFYHFMPAVCHCAPGPAHSLFAVHPCCTYGSAPLHTVLLAVTSPPRSRSIMPHAYPKDTPPRPTALALRLQIASPCICLHLPASRPSPADAGIEGHMDMSSTGRSPKRRKSASLPILNEGPIRAVRVLLPCPGRRVFTGRPSPCTYRG